MKYLSVLLLFSVFVGCSKEHFYEGMYNELQHRERLKNPQEYHQQPPKEDISYKEYKDRTKDTKY